MRLVIAVLALLAAVFVGTAVGWRWVIAPLMGYLIFQWGYGTLRGMVAGREGLPSATVEPTPVSPDERTLFWCEDCGTELLLTVRGTGAPPRHCGSAMHQRVELLGS